MTFALARAPWYVAQMLYAGVDRGVWSAELETLRAGLPRCTSLEQAAQLVTQTMCRTFSESTVLARVYTLLPNGDLAPDVAQFVKELAAGAKGADLSPKTPVLTLLGTCGREDAWQSRKLSRDHKGIPLLSGSFVDAIPMLARLLKELGIDLAWLDEAPEIATRRLLGGFNGVFFVEDAATAHDAKGRKIIPAADFVERYGVKTVFGMGGFYPNGTLVVVILFTTETLTRAAVESLTSLISMLKGETFGLVREKRIFER